MNKIFLAIISLLMCIAATAAPSVRWLETVHDFGTFAEDDGTVRCIFRFVNTGDEAVSIIKAIASCGCTAPQYSREAIAAGDTAFIAVSYNPAGRPGAFHKNVAVDFNFPGSRQRLDIRGTVIGSAASVGTRYPAGCFEGLSLGRGAVMVGEVFKGRMKNVSLPAYNSSDTTLSLHFETDAPYISVRAVPPAVPPGQQTGISVFFNSGSCPQYGLVEDSLRIIAGGLSCTIPVTANVKEDFSALTPEQLRKAPVAFLPETRADFGPIGRNDDALTKTVTLTNNGTRRLEIRRVYTTAPGISVSIDRRNVKSGQNATISITAAPAQLRGALLDARITVIPTTP